jgi:diguanylate cyclase (GGDEF)-like protein
MELAAKDPEKALAEANGKLEALRRDQPALLPQYVVCRGYAHERAGRNDQAMADYEAAVVAARQHMHGPALAMALTLRGEQNSTRGMYADAIADLKAAYDIELGLGDISRQLYVLTAIANLYGDRNVKDYDNALAYYRLILASNEQRGKLQGQATAHFNIGSTLESQGKLEPALASLQRALEIDRKLGVPADIAFDEKAVAVVLSKLGRHEDALRMLDHAMQLYGKNADRTDIAALRLSRGVALRRAGRFAQALPDIDAARAFFLAQNNARFLEKIHEERSLVLAGLGQWREAFNARGEYQEVHQKLQDQLLDERSARLRVQFDTEQGKLQNRILARENELARHELQSTRTIRNWQMVALVLSLAAILALAVLMTRQARLGRMMRDLAMTDELTRLPNRRHFLAVADAALQHAQQDSTPLAVAAIDIDFFKKVNDTHGHAAGDTLLQRVAHTLRLTLRPGDVVGRVGGEEFLALLRGANRDDALSAAERLRAAIEALDCSDIAPGLKPTISVGVAVLEEKDRKLDILCQRADAALYRAKESGRNRVESAA